MKYFRLLDKEHRGIIVRAKGESQQKYIPGRGWVESGVLLRYLWPDDELYDYYEEISEEEALKAITQSH